MIAITGASGFLGNYLLENIKPSLRVTRSNRLDTRVWSRWLINHGPSVVVHCAGLANVRACIDNPPLAFQANCVDTLTILDGLEGRKIPLIYIATDKVYGDQEQCTPFTPYKPLNPYDASKIAAEYAVRDFQQRNPCVIARFPNFYGFGDPHIERLMPSIILAICRGETTFEVRTNPDATRQYIYIEDAVRCIQKIINHPEAAPVHHFGTSIVKSVREVMMGICEAFNHKMQISNVLSLPLEANKLSLAYHTPFKIDFTSWEKSLDCFKLAR